MDPQAEKGALALYPDLARSPMSTLVPIYFLSPVSQVQTALGFSSFSIPCPRPDRGPEDKQNSRQAGSAEERRESWRHYNSQGMLRHTYDSS